MTTFKNLSYLKSLNLNMETLIVHPDNKEQLDALKTFMTAFKITFEEEKDDYDPEFVDKIQKARKQIEDGETIVVNIASL